MTTTSNEKKREYIGKGSRWFMEFLPDDVFNSLTPIQRKYYQRYRNYQKNVGRSQLRILELEKSIEELKRKIERERSKKKEWESKVQDYYGQLSFLDKDFKFSCTIEYRKRKSRKEGDPPYVYIYSHLVTTHQRVSIYLGNEELVKRKIGELYGEVLSDEDDKEILNEEYLRVIIRPFARYHIHKLGWDKMKLKSFNLDSITKWVQNVGWETVEDWNG